jgi:hypothetical protein
MKNVLVGVLFFVVLGTVPELSSAQVTTSDQIPASNSTTAVATANVSSQIIPAANTTGSLSSSGALIGISLALNSPSPSASCTQSSVNQGTFQYNAATNPASYTLSYTCTLTLTGGQSPVVSTIKRLSDTCPLLADSSACRNAALTAARAACSNACADYE